MTNRAYSILHVRALDAEARTLTGTATTPEPDRMNDIVEPLGVTFKNPLPLLLFHNATKPVGLVQFAKPTTKGIAFTATLPAVSEPGTLKDRVDEAWQSLKAGLIAGVSIGFRALEEAYMDNGGIHFLKTEVLELSLVTVPANASATIHTIKSIDAHGDAAPGTLRAVTTPPGASGQRQSGRTPMKTLTEQIAAFEATRAAKSARMTELMTTASEKGETLDTAQTEEYDGLSAEVKSIDAHLVRLNELEVANRKAAVPVTAPDPATGAQARSGVVTVAPTLPPGIEFARYAMCLMTAKGNPHAALDISKERYPDNPRIHRILKAAVAGGTTTDPTWAGALVPDYPTFAGDFAEFLRPQTIIGKFGMNGIPSLRRVPFNVRILGQTSGGSGYWVGQSSPKPVTKFDFAATKLGWAKVANIAVLSQELVRFSNPSAEMLVRDALAAALIERLDTDFVDPDKALVADVSPASITNGVLAGFASGTNAAAVRDDVQTLFATFIAANLTPTNGVWIMTNTTALSLSLMMNALGQPEFPGITMNGGTFMGLPVIASQYCASVGSPAGGLLILVNASDIYLSDDGQVVVDASREASLQMMDNPTNSPAAGSPQAPVPTQMVSLWQTDSIGLRAERFINWQRRRDAAVAYLAAVNYTA
jgi:HK97 family phage major capsid protein/HK97 family phage prohead protease